MPEGAEELAGGDGGELTARDLGEDLLQVFVGHCRFGGLGGTERAEDLDGRVGRRPEPDTRRLAALERAEVGGELGRRRGAARRGAREAARAPRGARLAG